MSKKKNKAATGKPASPKKPSAVAKAGPPGTAKSTHPSKKPVAGKPAAGQEKTSADRPALKPVEAKTPLEKRFADMLRRGLDIKRIQTVAKGRDDKELDALAEAILAGKRPPLLPGKPEPEPPEAPEPKPKATLPPASSPLPLSSPARATASREELEAADAKITEAREHCDRCQRELLRWREEYQKAKQARRALGPTPRAPREPGAPRKIGALTHAAILLAETGEALSCKEIVTRLAGLGRWSSPGGQTPEATVNAGIVTEIRNRGAASRFMKDAPGRYRASKMLIALQKDPATALRPDTK